VAVKILEV